MVCKASAQLFGNLTATKLTSGCQRGETRRINRLMDHPQKFDPRLGLVIRKSVCTYYGLHLLAFGSFCIFFLALSWRSFCLLEQIGFRLGLERIHHNHEMSSKLQGGFRTEQLEEYEWSLCATFKDENCCMLLPCFHVLKFSLNLQFDITTKLNL